MILSGRAPNRPDAQRSCTRWFPRLLSEKGIDRLIGIGKQLSSQASLFDIPEQEFYDDTDSFLKTFAFHTLADTLVLVKGARPFSFEKIVHRIQQKAHDTVLEINLDALVHNLNYYRAKAGQGTKIMAMVKAFAYGSGEFRGCRIAAISPGRLPGRSLYRRRRCTPPKWHYPAYHGDECNITNLRPAVAVQTRTLKFTAAASSPTGSNISSEKASRPIHRPCI